MFGPEAVAQLVGEGQDRLVDGARLAVVEHRDEAGVLLPATDGADAGKAGSAVVEVPEKQQGYVVCRKMLHVDM